MRRTLVLGLVSAVVSLGAGVLVFSARTPSEEEIQRYGLEELAEDSPLLSAVLEQPMIRQFIEGILETSTDRVSDRVLDESRDAMVLGAGTMVLLNVAGVALIAIDHRRRHDGPPAPTGPNPPAPPAPSVPNPSGAAAPQP